MVPAPMLAVFLFIAFWVVLAVSLVFIAISGGLGGARQRLQSQTSIGRRVIGLVFAVTYVGFGIALPVVLLTGNHANANKQVSGIKLTADEKRGREIFGERCGVCHTLAAANAVGKVGPNLDVLKPPASLVENTIANGCLQNPPPGDPEVCLGQGTMPPQIVQGRDAKDVAQFVARVAGR
jgi:mono/diheme cytochrome c family protein